MRSLSSSSLLLLLLLPAACADRSGIIPGGSGQGDSEDTFETETFSGDTFETDSLGSDSAPGSASTTDSSDSESDSITDSDSDSESDSITDSDSAGDGDGDTSTGDGDGDIGTGDGDGDMTTGDGDGDMTTGDGDGGLIDIGGDYWIASTETSVEAYAGFLDSDPGLDTLPAECAWKSDHVPDSWNTQLGDDTQHPVVHVDWCDAWAYCDWSGGHLCGLVGGAPAVLADFDDPVDNEWFRACSDGGNQDYPYVGAYDGQACNGADAGNGSLNPVASMQDCEGGAPGLFDMSGNAWEWTHACANSPNTEDANQECRRRGGSYFSSPNILRCTISSTRPRNHRNGNTGFRCCGPV